MGGRSNKGGACKKEYRVRVRVEEGSGLVVAQVGISGWGMFCICS